MNPIDITITKYKVIAACIVMISSLVAAAAAGAVVSAWRLDGDHQRALATEKVAFAILLAQHNDLKLANEKRNGAADLLALKAETAEVRREQAERYAVGIVASADRRIADINASKAATCDAVLREAWGTR